MELIRIGENKIKIMLSATDMSAYDLPTEGLDYCDGTVRRAFRAILKDAGKRSGIDFSGGGTSIQLYPSRNGGCEMFVTRNGLLPDGKLEECESVLHRKDNEPQDIVCKDPYAPRWERSEAFGFESMRWLLSVCRRLKRVGFSGNSAAYRDETGRCFLLVEESEGIRPLIIEYGTPESPEAVRLYISEHGRPLCTRGAVEILGDL